MKFNYSDITNVNFNGYPVDRINFNDLEVWSSGTPIALSVTPATLNFPTREQGQTSSVTVTVRNTGSSPTGTITLTQNPSAFTLSRTTIPSIAAGGSAAFTITSPSNLSVGSHNVSVTISAENVSGSVTRSGTLTVTEAPVFTVSHFHFENARLGVPIPPAVMTIRNPRNQAVSVTVSGSPASFTLNPSSVNIPANGFQHIRISPPHGLEVGQHSVTVTVSGGGLTVNRTGILTVRLRWNVGCGGGLNMDIANLHDSILNLFSRRPTTDGQNTLWTLIYDRLLNADENGMPNQEGIATWELDIQNKSIIMHMQKDVYFRDGNPLTFFDVRKMIEVVNHPNWPWNNPDNPVMPRSPIYEVWNAVELEGAAEFRIGEVDHIEGFTVSDDGRSASFHFVEGSPQMMNFLRKLTQPIGSIVRFSNETGHGIHDELFVGSGAFMVESQVPGEAISLIANENWHMGRPHLDGMQIEIIHEDMALDAMIAGQGHITIGGVCVQEFNMRNPSNLTLLGQVDNNAYSIVFNHSRHWDSQHPITNVNIRRAILHAVDRVSIADALWHVPDSSLWRPGTPHRYNGIGAWHFDLDKANQILDDSGFLRGSDGYRLDLNGSHMEFTLMASFNRINELLIPLMKENLRHIGLRVRLLHDMFIDPNIKEEKIDSEYWHIMITDINLTMWPDSMLSVFAPNGSQNFGAYSSPELYGIISDIRSPDALDNDFIMDAWRRLQLYVYEHALKSNILWRLLAIPVNNAVGGIFLTSGQSFLDMRGAFLTAPQPYVDGRGFGFASMTENSAEEKSSVKAIEESPIKKLMSNSIEPMSDNDFLINLIKAIEEMFPRQTFNSNPPIQGGILKVLYIRNTPFF